jgi:hypothetical protein
MCLAAIGGEFTRAFETVAADEGSVALLILAVTVIVA